MHKTFFLLLLTSISTSLFTAAPVVHVCLAELYLKQCQPTYTKKDKEAFIIGTLFPDIRYLARIDRKKTHSEGVTLKNVMQADNPFTAGKLFHSYVDEQRRKIALKENIWDHLKNIPANMPGYSGASSKFSKDSFLKIIEDELCYTTLDAHHTITTLKSYHKEEEKFRIPYYTIRAWHRNLRSYFRQSPLALLKERIRTKRGYFGWSPARVKECYNLMQSYTQDEKVISYVKKLRASFERMLVTP